MLFIDPIVLPPVVLFIEPIVLPPVVLFIDPIVLPPVVLFIDPIVLPPGADNVVDVSWDESLDVSVDLSSDVSGVALDTISPKLDIILDSLFSSIYSWRCLSRGGWYVPLSYERSVSMCSTHWRLTSTKSSSDIVCRERDIAGSIESQKLAILAISTSMFS